MFVVKVGKYGKYTSPFECLGIEKYLVRFSHLFSLPIIQNVGSLHILDKTMYTKNINVHENSLKKSFCLSET